MIGLLVKDIYNLGKNVKQLSISLVLFFVLAVNMKSASYLVFMMLLLSSMLVLTSLSYDEMAKWDKYALTMPIKRSELVKGKYILFLLLTSISTIISNVVGMILTTIFELESVKELLFTSVSATSGIILLYSILFPVIFKLGVEKGRIMIYVIFAIPAIVLSAGAQFLKKLNINITIPTIEELLKYWFFLPIILIVVVYISYLISVGVYEKKEF